MIFVPIGRFNSEDEAAARRKRIADALRNGESISIASSGEAITSDNSEAAAVEAITVPEGKLAR